MAQVVLQVLVEVDDVHEGLGEEIQSAVLGMLTDTGEISGEFFYTHGVKDVSVVFEDIV